MAPCYGMKDRKWLRIYGGCYRQAEAIPISNTPDTCFPDGPWIFDTRNAVERARWRPHFQQLTGWSSCTLELETHIPRDGLHRLSALRKPDRNSGQGRDFENWVPKSFQVTGATWWAHLYSQQKQKQAQLWVQQSRTDGRSQGGCGGATEPLMVWAELTCLQVSTREAALGAHGRNEFKGNQKSCLSWRGQLPK